MSVISTFTDSGDSNAHHVAQYAVVRKYFNETLVRYAQPPLFVSVRAVPCKRVLRHAHETLLVGSEWAFQLYSGRLAMSLICTHTSFKSVED